MYCEYFLSVCYLPFCKSILSPKTTSAFLWHFNSIKQKVNVFLLLVVCEKQDFLLMKDKKDIFLYSLIGVVEVLTFTFKSIIHFKYTFVVWGWALGSFFYYPDIQHHLLKKLLLHWTVQCLFKSHTHMHICGFLSLWSRRPLLSRRHTVWIASAL